MESLMEQFQGFGILLIQEQQQFLSKNQPIINFKHKHSSLNKKTSICGWNEPFSDDQIQSLSAPSPKIQTNRPKIQDFLRTLRSKKSQQYLNFYNLQKRKRLSLQNQHGLKPEKLLPVSSTLITFPKSRSQSRGSESDQKIFLQRLQRRKQKSKVIPKQLSMNTGLIYSAIKSSFPVKNYLSKNREFLDQKLQKKESNSEFKTRKDMYGYKRKFSYSYYNRIGNIFEQTSRNQNLLFCENKHKKIAHQKINLSFHPSLKKINSSINQVEKSPFHKLYRTLQSSPKFHNINLEAEQELSISKVKQKAKNSHLNRTKFAQPNEIHLQGSKMNKWKNEVKKKLNRNEENND